MTRIRVQRIAEGLALMLAVVALLLVMLAVQGCSGAGAGASDGGGAVPAISIVSVTGQGSIALDVYGQRVDVAFSERGVRAADGELVHCSVVERIGLNGFPLGAGYLPPPLSDPRCAESLPPFRPGQDLVAPVEPAAVVVPAGHGGDGATVPAGAPDADPAVDPVIR